MELTEELHPDAVLIDVGPPGLDGNEVARRIRATSRRRSIRIIAITGYGQAEDVARLGGRLRCSSDQARNDGPIGGDYRTSLERSGPRALSELVREPDRVEEAGERGISLQDGKVPLGGHAYSLQLALRLHVDDPPQGGHRVGGTAQPRQDAGQVVAYGIEVALEGERPLHLVESTNVIAFVVAAPT